MNPTPADELRAAAQRLRDLATAAQNDIDTSRFWTCYTPETRWRDGFVNGFGGVTAELAALFDPATATALDDWLDFEADLHDRAPHTTVSPCLDHALNLARLNNQHQEP